MKWVAAFVLVLAHSACAPIPREQPVAFNYWLYEIWPEYEPLTDAQIQALDRPRPAWAQPGYHIDTFGKLFMRPRPAPTTTVNVQVQPQYAPDTGQAVRAKLDKSNEAYKACLAAKGVAGCEVERLIYEADLKQVEATRR